MWNVLQFPPLPNPICSCILFPGLLGLRVGHTGYVVLLCTVVLRSDLNVCVVPQIARQDSERSFSGVLICTSQCAPKISSKHGLSAVVLNTAGVMPKGKRDVSIGQTFVLKL
jgi:hypothetical protein